VSCVWLCPTHIVLCYLFCLSSSCVLCMVVSDTGRRQTRHVTQHYMCWTQPYTRHRTTTNKTNNTTLYVLDTTIHKTQTTTNKTNNTTLYVLECCVISLVCRRLCLVYGCVICLACRRPVSCVWLCPTHIVLCYLSCSQHYMCWTQPYTRHRTTTSKTNNTTIHKTQDDDKQDK
jgi:hypothetical protein